MNPKREMILIILYDLILVKVVTCHLSHVDQGFLCVTCHLSHVDQGFCVVGSVFYHWKHSFYLFERP